jgi:hypothetical protein
VEKEGWVKGKGERGNSHEKRDASDRNLSRDIEYSGAEHMQTNSDEDEENKQEV